MNWRQRDRIIEAIFRNEPLYIRDTGVAVAVEYFGSDTRLGSSNTPWTKSKKVSKKVDEFSLVKIEFQSVPTIKALKLCNRFHIKRNSHSKTMELEAEIDIKNLSITPYETNAAKVLYEQAKTKKRK